MLKIKDNVDLKELEKFGFDNFGVCYKAYGDFGMQFFVNKGTREIKRLHPDSLREEPTEDEIFALIKADLVEKVED